LDFALADVLTGIGGRGNRIGIGGKGRWEMGEAADL
jgi:hypothetical protein